jgi:predicted unusual protein kinase regulating ubiquinone biosynthesis (AarF/ABC1/UbiB family)/nucleotide-binding universal stress UspA family protein
MVGTDRSETAERAVRWAAAFADRFGAELHVVQVITPEQTAGAEPHAAERLAAQADDLQRHVRVTAGERAHARIVVADDPATAMVRAAEEGDIDVLVVGNVGMAGRKEFLLGNVPNRITHNARCTVIIVNTLASDNGFAARGPYSSGDAEQGNAPHRFARASKIAAVFAKHGIRELFGWPDKEGTVGRRRQAKRLRSALEELGPTFAKIGQMLSERPDLLPPEFIEELAQLQDRVPPLTEQEVVRAMEADLKVPWEDVFETIEIEPLAAGTIAQVHRASLAGGEKVVVKIQRPEARGLIEQDLALLQLFAEKVGARLEVWRVMDVKAVFGHLSASLQGELDFRREAQNAERLRTALVGFPRLAVPRIHAEYSTERLLVMQDVGGVRTADMATGPIRQETARQLIESFCKQILIDGFFHADPHPGNLMWQPAEERLYLLDLGMVGEVGVDIREVMILLLLAFWQKDADFAIDLLLMLTDSTDRSALDMEAFRSEVEAVMSKYRASSTKNIRIGLALQELVEASLRNGVPLPASLTLTAKTLSQMQLLDPDVDPFEVAGRFLIRSLLQRMASRSNVETLFYQSQKVKVRMERAFEAIERMIGARPGEQPARLPARGLEDTVRRAARQLALALIAGFALLASALTASGERISVWVPIVFGLAGAACIVVLFASLLRGAASKGHTEA